MRKVTGSYTVEAAIIVPVVLFCMLLVINWGINLYLETVKTAESQESWKEYNPSGMFRKIELLEQAIE